MTWARWFHDEIHGSRTAVVNQIQKTWAVPRIHTTVKRIVSSCPTSWKFSDAKSKQDVQRRTWAYFPSQRMQINYADTSSISGHKNLLVITALSMGKSFSHQES